MCFLLLSGAPQKGYRAVRGSLQSLHAEVKFKPYWDGYLHFDASYTIVGHSLRCANNLMYATAYTLAALPMIFCSPLDIPVLPLVVGEHLLAACISAFTAVVVPALFVIRTLISVFNGYQETTQDDFTAWDWCSSAEEEQEDWDVAINPFIPEV